MCEDTLQQTSNTQSRHRTSLQRYKFLPCANPKGLRRSIRKQRTNLEDGITITAYQWKRTKPPPLSKETRPPILYKVKVSGYLGNRQELTNVLNKFGVCKFVNFFQSDGYDNGMAEAGFTLLAYDNYTAIDKITIDKNHTIRLKWTTYNDQSTLDNNNNNTDDNPNDPTDEEEEYEKETPKNQEPSIKTPKNQQINQESSPENRQNIEQQPIPQQPIPQQPIPQQPIPEQPNPQAPNSSQAQSPSPPTPSNAQETSEETKKETLIPKAVTKPKVDILEEDKNLKSGTLENQQNNNKEIPTKAKTTNQNTNTPPPKVNTPTQNEDPPKKKEKLSNFNLTNKFNKRDSLDSIRPPSDKGNKNPNK